MRNEAWIKIFESNSDVEDTVENFTEVLADMGITVWNDEETAAEEGVDLFIRMNRGGSLEGHRTWSNNNGGRDIASEDVLYLLTVSGDLADHYDNERGEGAFEALPLEQQQSIAGSVEKALDGFEGAIREGLLFDIGIANAGI